MMEPDVEKLKDQLTDEIAKQLPEQSRWAVRESVVGAIERLRAQAKLLGLTDQELNLLVDYRLWKRSPDAVSGVFHWRIR